MRQLSLRESFSLLARHAIPYTRPIYIAGEKDLEKVKKFPVVLKIDSEDVIHKSDVGAIVTNIQNHDDLKKAYHKILKNVREEMPRARIHGVAAFKQESGTELFVGMKRDSQFGNVIAFGLGGIFVEIMKDVSLRIAPFGKREAIKMIKEIQAYKVLEGARGQEPVKIVLVADLIVKASKMCATHHDIVEMDFNPVIANSKQAIVADVRILSRK
ncbi:MAG: acetate--CoA ligase family protein [Nanoarchaeota archaeon]|nr:acetate--CoA ligase family protein [Nanoarchaeota archaeon]